MFTATKTVEQPMEKNEVVNVIAKQIVEKYLQQFNYVYDADLSFRYNLSDNVEDRILFMEDICDAVDNLLGCKPLER